MPKRWGMVPVMIGAFGKTLSQIFSKPFRSILWRSLGMTLLLLVTLGAVGLWGTGYIPNLGIGWADTIIDVLIDAAVIVGLIFLVIPVTAIFIPLFLDEVGQAVEERHFPASIGPRKQGIIEGLWLGIKGLFVLLAVNLVALPLVFLLPGFGFVIFLVVNGFLLGREFFEAAAVRHYPPAQIKQLRKRHSGRVFVAGMAVAALLAIPIVNILVPLFGTAFMVHVLQGVMARDTTPTPAV
ncbi:EI24 domain-containing protein [Candidatus Phaeomarinobacter ectocarpi]|nr:EI24 domain-containing protein [Candidatus Phaeomarinobacter ectocarpi]